MAVAEAERPGGRLRRAREQPRPLALVAPRQQWLIQLAHHAERVVALKLAAASSQDRELGVLREPACPLHERALAGAGGAFEQHHGAAARSGSVQRRRKRSQLSAAVQHKLTTMPHYPEK
jgi:hypothetical protein